MHKLLFVDLDDTLFHSHHKRAPLPNDVPLAYLKDGTAISYANHKQFAMLQFWQQSHVMIPVTARNLDAFQRVDIAFEHGAITNYGGLILQPDGQIDPAWHQQSSEQACISSPVLQALVEGLSQFASAHIHAQLQVRIISDLDIPFYVLVKSKIGDLDAVSAATAWVKQWLLAQGWLGYQVHHNGNNLAIMPPWLNKRHAVRHVLQQWQQRGETVVFGMGDSLIDLGFMGECDYLVVPNPSQIAKQRMAI